MRTTTELDTLRAMRVYGGSFVEALAETFARADDVNFARLRQAFPDIWERYAEMARVGRARGEHS